MSSNIVFWNRNFSALVAPLQLKYNVEVYSHSVMGGPKMAKVTATGEDLELWELLEYLRRPIIIDDDGDPAWWGLVSSVQVEIEAWSVGVDIETMTNSVGMAYEDEANGGLPTVTDYLDAADSVSEYGKKQILFSTNGSTSIQALAARAKFLDEKKYPIPTITPKEKGPSQATINCRGWFDTLAWRYVSRDTGTEDTAIQVAYILDNFGEFISTVDREISSELITSTKRDGKGNASYEIGELLKLGTHDYKRMLCQVRQDRTVRLYEEPVPAIWSHLILKDGQLRDPYDTPLRRALCPVGIWARLKDIIPGSVDTSKLADPTLMFIDEAEYTPKDDILRLTPRGFIDPFQIGRPKDG